MTCSGLQIPCSSPLFCILGSFSQTRAMSHRQGRSHGPTSVSPPWDPSSGTSAWVALDLPPPGCGVLAGAQAQGKLETPVTAPLGTSDDRCHRRSSQNCQQPSSLFLLPSGGIYYGFEKWISDKDWKTFMRLVGLEDIDIENCECENRNNVTEQHHQMLLRWRTQLGREASVFKLFAALRKMQLHMHLENIINGLLAEGILGRRGDTSQIRSGSGLGL